MPADFFDDAREDPPAHRFVADPGPPTFGELPAAMDANMRAAAEGIRMGQWRASQESALGRGEVVKFNAEWSHWAAQKRRWEAFLRVHPELAAAPITARCRHATNAVAPSCYVGPDDGWYREPTGTET